MLTPIPGIYIFCTALKSGTWQQCGNIAVGVIYSNIYICQGHADQVKRSMKPETLMTSLPDLVFVE